MAAMIGVVLIAASDKWALNLGVEVMRNGLVGT